MKVNLSNFHVHQVRHPDNRAEILKFGRKLSDLYGKVFPIFCDGSSCTFKLIFDGSSEISDIPLPLTVGDAKLTFILRYRNQLPDIPFDSFELYSLKRIFHDESPVTIIKKRVFLVDKTKLYPCHVQSGN